jgi:hypothetical protein
MKTLIIQNGVVVNVGVGEPENPAPEGFTLILVPDDAYVGPGFTVNEDGTFTPPPPPPTIDFE